MTTTNFRIGTGAGCRELEHQRQQRAGGGFAAFNGPRKVDLGDPGVSSITWEGNNFVSSGNPLILNSTTANQVIELIDNLNLTAAAALERYQLRPARNSRGRSPERALGLRTFVGQYLEQRP